MKEDYSQPILIVQSFRINGEILTDVSPSQMGCNEFWCKPNGWHITPTGPDTCWIDGCEGGYGVNWGSGANR